MSTTKMEEVNDLSISRRNDDEDEEASDEDDDDEVTTHAETTGQFRRDEVCEVRKLSSKDTSRLRLWRIVVTGVLLLTALVVTFTTYTLLKKQEDKNFQTAFEQFARTVGDAAVDQQTRMRQSYLSFANHISATARQTNATWPFFRIPYFELHAGQTRLQSGSEMLGCAYRVEPSDESEYLKFVTANYEDSAVERHMSLYGNLNRLNKTGYTANYTILGPNGMMPDTLDRPIRWVNWQSSPPAFTYSNVNWDITNTLPDSFLNNGALLAMKSECVVSPFRKYANSGGLLQKEHDALHSTRTNSDSSFPHSILNCPVHEIPGDSESKIVSYIYGGFSWDFALRYLLPDNVKGIIVRISNSCNQTSLYEVVGHDTYYLGGNATHESKYDNMQVVRDIYPSTHPNFTSTPGHCRYTIHIYPSTTFQNKYITKTPKIYAGVVAFTFALVALVFFIYDILVQFRNEKIVYNAARSNAIVSSMFPDAFRDRLLQNSELSSKRNTKTGHLKSYLLTGEGEDFDNISAKPLADLFLETTIMFADISGFTAWSSVREPTQVFVLLESLYKAFDAIASRRRVFKVETVGDCYVAVTGLPEYRKDHAVVMARFARDIMSKMDKLAKVLELSLGPGTGELKLRIGMHSGPVTGGVLRGERSRFQLFGDTMNTTARIESTGERGCIHLSEETATLLKQAGKQSWLKRRDQRITAKGKGSMQTYWLTVADSCDDNTVGADSDGKHSMSSGPEDLDCDDMLDGNGQSLSQTQHTDRLIKWNVEQLLVLLKQIVARRSLSKAQTHSTPSQDFTVDNTGTFPIEEVQEVIALPEFDNMADTVTVFDMTNIVIPPIVEKQLKVYVTWVASMYRNNPFHNFDHASHVVMSVIKLMSRIVAPTDQHFLDNAATLHDHTYGITSDPLTQFACVFSALIHDVDHTGVPNTTLVTEHSRLATKYNNRSVAEQNSLDLAWNVLMGDSQYSDLRAILFASDSDLSRFRKLVVNGVMATDIADKDLKTLRNNRWDKAFKVDPKQSTVLSKGEQRIAVNRKATIVIEHLIQASDVSHTMQHWHVFRKWNQQLFEEMYEAYVNGRADKNPADFWYQGEIGFFDYYIIPLAKKLKDCGVFGVSSDEYLNYAMKNREEWEIRGHEVVAEMVEAVIVKANACQEELPPKHDIVVLDGMNDSASALGKSFIEC